MKKKFFSLSVVAIVLITSSCSSDIDEGQTPAVNSGGQVITFEPWASKQTKAAMQADDMIDFAVLATDTAAADVLINGAVVTGSNATKWIYSPTAFWPETATVNFFAFSPTDAVNVAGGAAALVGQSDDPTAGTPVIEYELPVLLSDQKDLLVARHSGAYSQDGTTGVRLNFRHALSRVLFQAKSESATEFEVLSIKLMNLKGKATLDLNDVPKDTQAFPYPKNNAEIATTGYQIFWEPDGITNINTLEATLTTPDVPGDGDWHYVVGDADALYVIPQINTKSSMDSATVVDASFTPLNEFYIEISYQEKVDSGQPPQAPKTYAVPVPAIVGDARASSIAFEMERQYTFQFELTGRKMIEFKGVTVSNYSNVTQEEPLRLQWAGSNIYWDGSKLTFADSGDKSKEKYQGVFFKWGSLVGMSPAGAENSGWSGRTYYPTNPGVDNTWATNTTAYGSSNYGGIPFVSDAPIPYARDNAYLTTLTNDPITGPTAIAARKGDICVYLTKTGAAPAGKRWRMPTSTEFGDAMAEYIRNPETGGFTPRADQNANGQSSITGGWQRGNSNHPYFPASGFRNYTSGSLNSVGIMGDYWSSSPNSALNGYIMYFGDATVMPGTNNFRAYGFSVRCVVE
jgi:hypothetical protein